MTDRIRQPTQQASSRCEQCGEWFPHPLNETPCLCLSCEVDNLENGPRTMTPGQLPRPCAACDGRGCTSLDAWKDECSVCGGTGLANPAAHPEPKQGDSH
jgi:hypothetical protein